MIGSALGYPVEICLPAGASEERKRLLKLYGASIIETPAIEGTDGAIRKAKQLYEENPTRYFYPDQYNNPANWQAHYFGTAEEIWRQTGGRVTHFVAVVGTSGTLVGTARRLKEYNPEIQVVEVQPEAAFPRARRDEHMPTAIVPGIYDPSLADVAPDGRNRRRRRESTRELARYEGILAGPSGGAAVLAALRWRKHSAGAWSSRPPDGGSRYLGDSFWHER